MKIPWKEIFTGSKVRKPPSPTTLKSPECAVQSLQQQEREQRVALIDFDDDKTVLTVFSNGIQCHSSSLRPIGRQLTCDLIQGLRVTVAEAEGLKRRHGCCLDDVETGGDSVEIGSMKGGNRMIPRRAIVEILEMRTEEFLGKIAEELRRHGDGGNPVSAAVITGGCARMPGLDALARRVLAMPVRIASPPTP